jgi:HAD superfamily hydrolase (TIGR01549 family)
MSRLAIFDLDGTLVDSDEALIAPFVALGIDRSAITFGHVLAVECQRLGISLDAYLDAYDEDLALPFAGADALVSQLDRWAICSNKHPRPGWAELERLGWHPDVVLFSDAFEGPKQLGPVLRALDASADEVVFIGDTAHDRACAATVGVTFGLAGWNPRAVRVDDDIVLAKPGDVLDLLAPMVGR